MKVQQKEEQILNYSDYQQQDDQEEANMTNVISYPPSDLSKYLKSNSESIDLIYILFNFYKQKLVQIAKKNNCDIQIYINCYLINSFSQNDEQKKQQCMKQVKQFIKNINYVQFTKQKLRKIQNIQKSHHAIKLFSQKGIKITKFNKCVYFFSQTKRQNEIISEITEFNKNFNIYCVIYRKRFLKQRYYVVYQQISKYLQKALQYYKNQFKKASVIVEVSIQKNFINLIGQKPKDLMYCKSIVKNILQSVFCLNIRNTNINFPKLQKFFKKAVLYPIYCSYQKQKILIITKDNILKQLLIKYQDFLTYLGLVESQINQPGHEAVFGFSIIRSPSFADKLQKIRNICQQKGFDFDYSGIYITLRKIFIQQNSKIQTYKQLLINIVKVNQQMKIKYDLFRIQQKKIQKLSQKIIQNIGYQIISGKIYNQTYSNLFKRQVLTQKIKIDNKKKKQFDIQQIQQSECFWVLNQGKIGKKIKINEIKQGQYMKGSIKKINSNQQLAKYEQILHIL